MNEHPNFVKKSLLSIIEEMSQHVDTFVKHPGKDFSRNRIFDFSTMLKFILSMGNNTIASEIFRFFSYERFPTPQAFVQQRTKILPEAFQYLFHRFHVIAAPEPKLFQGYQLLAVDGSGISLPYNEQDAELCNPEEHYNYMHLNTLYDLCSKYYVDAQISKNESGTAADMVKHITDKYPVILVADRGYESYNLFANVEERLFDYVIRIKNNVAAGILSGLELPDEDEFDIEKNIVITRHGTGPAMVNRKKYKLLYSKSRFDFIPDLKAPDYELCIRFVKFHVDEENDYVLATSLSKEDMSVEKLKQIYQMRWGIETSYRTAKYVLGLETVHSKKSECIIQEIYAELIMYNFSMYIATQVEPRPSKGKHPVQINFTQAVKICMDFFRMSIDISPPDIEAIIQKFTLPVRYNRSFQRIVVSPTVHGFNYRLP